MIPDDANWKEVLLIELCLFVMNILEIRNYLFSITVGVIGGFRPELTSQTRNVHARGGKFEWDSSGLRYSLCALIPGILPLTTI